MRSLVQRTGPGENDRSECSPSLGTKNSGFPTVLSTWKGIDRRRVQGVGPMSISLWNSQHSPVSRLKTPWATTDVRVRVPATGKWGRAGSHPRHPRSGSTSTTSCVPVAVVIVLVPSKPQTGSRMTGQSAASRRHLACARSPTSLGLAYSWLSPVLQPARPCLGPTACVASESGRLRLREAVHIGMRARDHHRSGSYEAGAKLRSPGHPLSSLLDRRSVTEFLSISLSISSFCRRSAAYFVCCLPGRGGRGGKGQLPKSGSQPGLHPAPPCHTKRAPSSACSPVPGTILGAGASQESRACAQTSRRSRYAIVTWKSSHVRGAWGGGTSQGAPCQCNGFLIPSDVAKTPFCERRDS